jgi:glutamine synthetase
MDGSVAAGASVLIATTDFAGVTRGRAVPRSLFDRHPAPSVGWVPAMTALSCFDVPAAAEPWGAKGDLRLRADGTARYRATIAHAAPLDLALGDLVTLEGDAWEGCPRTFLRRALGDLESLAGLRLRTAFEHEFQVEGAGWAAAPSFSVEALRRADPLTERLFAALAEAGLEPEVILPEFGRDQFEAVIAPAIGMAAADRAVALRVLVREVARTLGWRATFAPKTAVEGVGNGVHIHLSLVDAAGRNVTRDPALPGGLSATAAAFAAGIMRHLPALIGFTAPSVASALRLRPHLWSAAYTAVAVADRESALRICPGAALDGRDPAMGFNLEYRPADAASCPHLSLGVLVRAGLEGICAGLKLPPLAPRDPDSLSADERRALGIAPLPPTLAAALDAMATDDTVRGWFDPAVLAAYLSLKRTEIATVAGLDEASLCRRYAAVY